MKNAFALINKTSPDVLSLIPEYWNHRQRDKEIIKLTHVCHGWRELFTSRPSLWNRLDCVDVNKTHTYLERSKSSPLEISLKKDNEKPVISYRNDALVQLVPHYRPSQVPHCHRTHGGRPPGYHHPLLLPGPLLEKLSIIIRCHHAPILDPALFNGDPSFLRTLELEGVAGLPWNNLPNLTSFSLDRIPESGLSVTALLDFFESAPLLRKISLISSMPNICDVPPGRVIYIPRLEEFVVGGPLPYSTLLDHISIRPNALMMMVFNLTSDRIPIQEHHPRSFANFRHISHITQISVGLRGQSKLIQLYGPSGRHCINAKWVGEHGCDGCPVAVNTRMLQSLVMFDTSRVQRLAVTRYAVSSRMSTAESPPYQVLCHMENLRTLILTECYNLLFFAALNPEKTLG